MKQYKSATRTNKVSLLLFIFRCTLRHKKTYVLFIGRQNGMNKHLFFFDWFHLIVTQWHFNKCYNSKCNDFFWSLQDKCLVNGAWVWKLNVVPAVERISLINWSKSLRAIVIIIIFRQEYEVGFHSLSIGSTAFGPKDFLRCFVWEENVFTKYITTWNHCSIASTS